MKATRSFPWESLSAKTVMSSRFVENNLAQQRRNEFGLNALVNLSWSSLQSNEDFQYIFSESLPINTACRKHGGKEP